MKKVFILFLSISLLACNNSENYQLHSTGLEYRVLHKSSNTQHAKDGDVVELKLKYFDSNGSLLFNSQELTSSFKMKVNASSHKGGSFEDAIKMMSIGDRYQFKIVADSFYTKTKATKIPENIEPSSKLIFDVELVRTVEQEEIEREVL